MKNILFFVSSMHAGGAERVAAYLCNHWARENINIILVPTYSKRGECFYNLDHRVKLIFLADLLTSKKSNFFSKIRRIMLMRDLMKKYNPDIILSFLTDVNIAAILSSLGLKKTIIISERIHPSLMPLPFYLKILRFIVYRKADHLVVQTKRTKSWFHKKNICKEISVIPNPIAEFNTNELKNSELENSDKPFILAIGRLNHAKGFDILIEAYANLYKKKDIPNLIIIGEGEEKKNLEDLIIKEKLTSKIYLLGKQKNILSFYNNACLFVLSSRFEGFPNVLVEAIANKVPVVAFDCLTGPREILEEHNAGLLISLDSGASGLEMGINDALTNLKINLSDSSKSIKDAYNIKKIGSDWVDLFNSFQ